MINLITTKEVVTADARRSGLQWVRRAAAAGYRYLVILSKRLTRVAVLGGAICLAGGVQAEVQLPDFGSPSDSALSQAEARALGEALMRELRARLILVEDPEIERYIQALGYHLLASSNQQNLGFTFFVVNESSVNAFAAPGGFIGINSGLILETQTESELASVMAHEIAHVTQGHINRVIDYSSSANLLTLAGVIAGILIGVQTEQSDAGAAVVAGALGSRAQTQIDLIRKNELEADRVGMQILANAEFNPLDMARFFEKLQNAARYYQRPPPYLSTHPITADRIAESYARAKQLAHQHQSSETYFLVRANLRVHTMNDPQRVLDRFIDEHNADQAQSKTANAYGQALAMIELGRENDANAILERLVEAHPDNLTFLVAFADSALRMGDSSRALALYSEGLDWYPGDKILIHGYAAVLNRTDQPQTALKLINEYERFNLVSPEMRKLRAEAYEKLGQSIDSHAELAEYYYLSGQLERALNQLRLAERMRDQDFHRTARIKARIKELEAEQP